MYTYILYEWCGAYSIGTCNPNAINRYNLHKEINCPFVWIQLDVHKRTLRISAVYFFN